MTYFWKAWDWAVALWDSYVEVIDWLQPSAIAVIWPVSLAAVWWWM